MCCAGIEFCLRKDVTIAPNSWSFDARVVWLCDAVGGCAMETPSQQQDIAVGRACLALFFVFSSIDKILMTIQFS